MPILLLLASFSSSYGQSIETIPYGDFSEWVTRPIRESVVIGGHNINLHEVGPENEITENIPYCKVGDSPWATSNVYAKISGVVKASETVLPHLRGHGEQCAKLITKRERVRVLGVVDIDYLVAGSLFLGQIIEPITDLNNIVSKVNMGMEYSKRPKYLSLDYMLDVPFEESRLQTDCFSGISKEPSEKNAKIYVLLQRRWEDSEGNIHATRVGTGGEILSDATPWINGHRIGIHYGDCSEDPSMKWLGLRNGENAFYAFNSKGDLVKINEEGWAKADETPTHVILMIRTSDEKLNDDDEGTVLYVDNIAFGF